MSNTDHTKGTLNSQSRILFVMSNYYFNSIVSFKLKNILN